MKYTDASGTERTLTRHQLRYLTALAHRGHLELGRYLKAHLYDSRLTMRLLQERGLVTGRAWHCPLSPLCLTGLTDLGREVLRPSTTTIRTTRSTR